jgi:hypothetical protein
MKKLTEAQRSILVDNIFENIGVVVGDGRLGRALKGVLLSVPDSTLFSLYRSSRTLDKPVPSK